ncbi:serine/threonine-protein kinase [Mycobacterium sp. Aquia_216]|uniref:serine/threonine-protein kinase n=1 Tax=Mycobacterium sp. Aquia_216 TaxID=2991729 RepID=UPI003FA37279
MPLGEGAQFAGYTVGRLLGIGGMGEVYAVRHPRLPRLEALKILRADVSADPDYQQRFNREAELAGGLWHPHIVGVHDRGEFEGQLWIAMDYVNGPDTRALMDRQYSRGMPPGEVVAIVTAVGAALDYAHHRGLLHRDVKPGNIMISRPDDGSPPRILLSDFGIARPVDDNTGLTVTNATVGTVDYCAPEQLLGSPLDGRADQYALAATAYYLLTGAKLFANASPVAVISAHLTAPPPLPGMLRPDLAATDRIFARALAKNPAERFDRCSDFAAALAGQLHASTAELTRPAPAPPPRYAPPGPPRPVAPGPPPSGVQRRKLGRRRGVRIAALLTAGITVVAVVALMVIPRLTDHGRHAATQLGPQQQEAARLAGQHYLEALARGDAAAALALSVNPPATTQFATVDVLRAQLAAMPISAITATQAPVPAGDDPQQVQYLMLSARFGPTLSQARVAVRRDSDEWKLDTATVAVDIGPPGSTDASLKAVALWGVATDGASPVAVFPGALSVSSSNRFVDISAQTPPVLLDALGGATDRPTIKPAAALNDVGRQAAKTAIDNWVHYCYRGAEPPPDCPRLSPDNPTIDISASPGDFTKTTLNFDAAKMVVSIGGSLVYQGHAAGVPDYTVTLNWVGTVDLTKDPPVFTRTAGR